MCIRKLIIVALFVLLPGFVFSACLDRRDTLRVTSFRQAGLNTSGNQRIDAAAANLYVNTSIQKVSSDFPAVVKHRMLSIAEFGAVQLIDTLFDSLLFCGYKDSTRGIVKTLRKVSYELDWEKKVKGKISAKDTTETTYSPEFVMIAGDSLVVNPTPQFGGYLEITYSVIGKKLTHDTMKTDIRPAYRDLIVLWTAYLMSVELGLYEQAAFLRAEYDLRYARSQRTIQAWELVQ